VKGKDYHTDVHRQAATRSPPVLAFLLVFLSLEDETAMYMQNFSTNHPVMQRQSPEEQRPQLDHCESVRTHIGCND
jgi:hypothetical protein